MPRVDEESVGEARVLEVVHGRAEYQTVDVKGGEMFPNFGLQQKVGSPMRDIRRVRKVVEGHILVAFLELGQVLNDVRHRNRQIIL